MKEFSIGDQVIYVPDHAEGNHGHADCEHGLVSSMNDKFVFVRYIRNGILHSTAQATKREDIFHDGDPFLSGNAIAELQGQIQTLHLWIDELRKAHIAALELATKEKL